MATKKAYGDSRTYFQTRIGEDNIIEGEVKEVTSKPLTLPAPTCIICDTEMDGYGECPNCDYNHD